MKSLLFSIPLVILSFQPLLSQNYHPFPDSNATWCDERVDNGWPANYFYYFYKTDGKSAINDTVYTKISDNYNQTTFYLREENKMVFCRLNPGESEFVLYDFDINPGDTVMLHQLYGQDYPGFVEEVDSLLIGTEYHKRYFIQSWEWLSIHIIEGVGSEAGLMYCDIPWVDVWGNIHCFSVNDTIYGTDGAGDKSIGNCWKYIGISENYPGLEYAYPNPASDHIQINYDKECKLELIDLTGRQCLQSLSNSIYVRDIDQGIYFLRVYSVTGTLLNQFKILKVNAR